VIPNKFDRITLRPAATQWVFRREPASKGRKISKSAAPSGLGTLHHIPRANAQG
jgi:hypothetical protein